MKKVDMLVKTNHLYTMAGEGVGYLSDTAMVVDRGRIVDFIELDLVDQAYKGEEVLELFDHALFPGFIDAHTHLDLCIVRGMAQDMNNWWFHGLLPLDNAITRVDMNAGNRLGVMEAVRAGTTTIGEFEIGVNYICEFIEKVGIRGHIAETVRSAIDRQYGSGELYEFDENAGKKSLQENIAMYEKWHNRDNGRIKILFGPQAADLMSKDLLLEVQREAKKRKTKIHMHMQQSSRETEQVVARYGKRPIGWLNEIGYLDETLIAVHLTDADAEETALVAKSGAGMIVCPGSLGILDGFVCPSLEFQEAGGYVALGSDEACGNNCHNIINEMKLVALFNKIKTNDPEILPAWKALRMATIEGAKAIGLGDDIGSLECGKKADFIAIDLNKYTMRPVFTKPMRNIVPNLVYSARGDEVALSAVDGKVIYRNGKILNIDEQTCLEEIGTLAEALGNRAEKEFNEIKSINYRYMKENRL